MEDYDWCYECQGYGNDYGLDENGKLVDNCVDCPFNDNNWEDDCLIDND